MFMNTVKPMTNGKKKVNLLTKNLAKLVTTLPEEPFQKWILDFIRLVKPTNKLSSNWFIIITIDYATKWVEAVATLTWPSVGVKPNTWKELGFGVLRLPNVQSAIERGKTPRIGVFLVSLKRS